MKVLGKVDKHSGIPSYLQIMNLVRKAVLSGRLSKGDKLPPVRKLRKIFEVNVNTVSKALERLRREGVVTVRHGVGYFISDSEDFDTEIKPAVFSLVKEARRKTINLHTLQLLIEEAWNETSSDKSVSFQRD